MKKLFLLILLSISSYLFCVDLKTTFSFNNFNFNDDNEIKSSEFDFEFSEVISQEVSDGLKLDAGIEKSIITDYSVFTDFSIRNEMFGFNIGLFTNFLNESSKILTPGLNYGINFTIPGVTILDLRLNNTIPNTSPLETGISINNYDIMLGLYLGEAIVSLNLDSENSTKGDIITSTSTSSTKYFLNLDLFNKYLKYRISLDFGWNYMTRKVTQLIASGSTLSGSTLADFEAGSAYLDSLVTLILKDNLTIDLGVLVYLIKVPLKNIASFPANEFNWGLTLGVNLFL